MIIKNVILENFQSYFGTKEFKFKRGLNVILGANSHGKSKLFDAITWLMNGEVEEEGIGFNKENLISKKALKYTEPGEYLTVSVSMKFKKNDNEFVLTRKYNILKRSYNSYIITESFDGYQSFINGERKDLGGEQVLENGFPAKLRKYSLFKGEGSLNIFDPKRNPNALKDLVKALSRFKSFNRYIKITDELEELSKRAVERLAKASRKNKTNIDRLIYNRDHTKRELAKIDETIKNLEENLERVSRLMDENVGMLEKGEAIKQMNNNIKKISDKITRIDVNINNNSDYTKFIFDDLWILNQFSSIQDKYIEKIKKFSREKRKKEKYFQIEQGKKIGKEEIIAEISKTSIPLPIGTPSIEHMEEMLNEEICKVCNRVAEKGSEPYEYMNRRLKEFLKTLKPEIDKDHEEEVAFKNNFLEGLKDIAKRLERNTPTILNIESKIIDNIDFIDRIKNEKKSLLEDLEEKEDEKERLLGKYSTGETDLLQIASDIRKHNNDEHVYNTGLTKYRENRKRVNQELQRLEIEINKINISDVPAIYLEKKNILFDLSIIAKDTKEKKYNEFLIDLKERANKYYTRLGGASEGYTGVIDIYKYSEDKVKVIAIDANGDDITNLLSQSTITSLHLSVLMAISEIAVSINEDTLPIIFDAPISDFDNSKSLEFFKIAKESFEQSIIMMKNYIKEDPNNEGDFFIEDEFKDINADVGYWVKLDKDIDPKDLETVDSEIIKLF